MGYTAPKDRHPIISIYGMVRQGLFGNKKISRKGKT